MTIFFLNYKINRASDHFECFPYIPSHLYHWLTNHKNINSHCKNSTKKKKRNIMRILGLWIFGFGLTWAPHRIPGSLQLLYNWSLWNLNLLRCNLWGRVWEFWKRRYLDIKSLIQINKVSLDFTFSTAFIYLFFFFWSFRLRSGNAELAY